ncbi:acyltransferase family protein [Hydrocarboniclastica marina]|uniref:Acyltransferase n=1 Tax=Hydrocarboniclastica marina TaxID=2259620 RepID=A0A4P7XDW9_9ALTE|nr:acyltransferase [Hydrocarboniclastica marina]MAL99542.1 acyltransferase [Alteromonadaceae bacterium]QCF25048.1 acyltransferase [Hydrocarboniclastica marina]
MTQPTPRLKALDALRGIAALAVVLFHYVPYYHQLYGHDFEPWRFLEFGRYGVHLFFILSGFVIFMTLEKTASAGWFGLARAFRLLPALWIAIPITFLSVQLLGPENRAVLLTDALWNFTLLHEYLGRPHVDGAYWSLVIEATFYVWMAVLFYKMGSGKPLFVVMWLWVGISYLAVMFWTQIPDGLEFLVKDLLFTRYAPLFISGMLLYRWHSRGAPAVAERLLLTFSVCHAFLAYPAPFSLFVLACYGTFALAAFGFLDRIATRPLLLLGSVSYSLYLIHQNLGYGIIGWGYSQQLPGLLSVGLALSVSMVLAYAIHRWVEKPALRWFRDHRRKSAVDKIAVSPERPRSVL